MTTVDWSDENIETLKRMWADRLPASLIAGAIGCTKNAVIGKVHRLKLPPHSAPIPSRRRPVSPPRPKIKTVGKVLKVKPMKPVPVEPEETPDFEPEARDYSAAWVPLPGSSPVPLEHHTTGCRWTVDLYGVTMFCNLPVTGRVYCAAHTRRAGSAPTNERIKPQW